MQTKHPHFSLPKHCQSFQEKTACTHARFLTSCLLELLDTDFLEAAGPRKVWNGLKKQDRCALFTRATALAGLSNYNWYSDVQFSKCFTVHKPVICKRNSAISLSLCLFSLLNLSTAVLLLLRGQRQTFGKWKIAPEAKDFTQRC